jgi:2-polyprenyl-3-methyl-5-hydroxy-6-metoxy-1,4-benzoquinol methylase
MHCPACNNRQFLHRKLASDLNIAICSQCSFQISDIKRSAPAKPEFSLINDEQYERSIGKLRQHQAGEILQFVREHVKAGGAWLDVGCSFGYLLAEAQQAGFSIFGVEPDAKAARRARTLLGNGVVHHGLMTDATRENNSADIVSMLDVLEHIPVDMLPGFAEMIHRKLKPHGFWLIKVPSTEGLYYTVAHALLPYTGSVLAGIIKRLWQSEYEYPHTVYFNRDSLALFLARHGYEITATKYLAEVPNNTVMDRLRMDNTIPAWQAMLLAPALYLINAIEKVRGKSDALLVLAKRMDTPRAPGAVPHTDSAAPATQTNSPHNRSLLH